MRKKRTPSTHSGLWKRTRSSRFFWLGAGIAGGCIAAGILALLMIHVIQPLSQPETWGYTIVEGDRFNLWYAKGSDAYEDRDRLAADLERELESVLTLLDVDATDLPLPIDVFVHENFPAMQSSISRRKSRNASTYFEAVLEILAGSRVRPSLVEIVLAKGWGQCFSQSVYLGMLQYASSPETDFLCSVAAAPAEMRHTIRGLLQVEAEGRLPETLYQKFGGALSSRVLLSFEDLHDLYSLSVDLNDSMVRDFARMELASLIQYLIESTEGVDTLRSAWGPGTSEALLQRFASVESVDELSEAWNSAVDAAFRDDCPSEQLRVQLLLTGGHIDEALAITKGWTDQLETSSQDAALATHCALAAGEFSQARDSLRWVHGPDHAEIEIVLDLYADWNRWESPELVVLAPQEMARENPFERIQEALHRVCLGAEASISDSLRPIVFLYPDPASRSAGAKNTRSDPSFATSIHLAPDDDWAYELAHTFLPRLWGPAPTSPLTRVGIASFLATPMEELKSAGTELSCGSGWNAMSLLDIGTTSENVLRVEMGLLFAYIHDELGLDSVKRVWTESRETGSTTLESSLRKILGTSKREIEEALRDRVLRCPPPPSPAEESSS